MGQFAVTTTMTANGNAIRKSPHQLAVNQFSQNCYIWRLVQRYNIIAQSNRS